MPDTLHFSFQPLFERSCPEIDLPPEQELHSFDRRCQCCRRSGRGRPFKFRGWRHHCDTRLSRFCQCWFLHTLIPRDGWCDWPDFCNEFQPIGFVISMPLFLISLCGRFFLFLVLDKVACPFLVKYFEMPIWHPTSEKARIARCQSRCVSFIASVLHLHLLD